MDKLYKCFICSLQISELSTLKSHIRIIHNIKDDPYLKLKCCNNLSRCDSTFLSYSAFSRHMLNCINLNHKPVLSKNDQCNTNVDNILNLNSNV